VTDRPVPFILPGERIAVCRLGGRPAAFKDLCIHRGTPISLGWTEGAKREQLTGTVMAQDLVIIENQLPEELPLDLSEELHVKGPDAIALEYRRFPAELGVE
jgi:phenylpropionate dioxygenase-like ring-hydroxylating dioxygenase large terminal subunit